MELYEKDGKVGVLVSKGYGAGWSTWNFSELAYDKRVIEFWLSHKDDKKWMRDIDKYTETKAHAEAETFFSSLGYGNPYMGGFADIELEFVDKGVPWRISEYDGSEQLETFDGAGFMIFQDHHCTVVTKCQFEGE